MANPLIKNLVIPAVFAGLVTAMVSCSHVAYTPHTKAEIQREKPSVVLLNNIVDFRETFNEWPITKEYFIAKGKKYKESFDGFKYLTIRFKIVDNDKMTFYFSDHIKDASKQSSKIDLNALGGEARFFKDNGKFVWKLIMY